MRSKNVFSRNEACGKKDSTTSLNVGEQFLDEGFYENNEKNYEGCTKHVKSLFTHF
jgi:hypothetical protein